MITRRILLALAVLALALPAAAQSVNSKDGLALKGYDAVAYFNDGKPVAGSRKFHHQMAGCGVALRQRRQPRHLCRRTRQICPAIWRFLRLGGRQRLHRGDRPCPPSRSSRTGLYLNYSKSVQRDWEKDVPGNITKADGNWPKLSAPK